MIYITERKVDKNSHHELMVTDKCISQEEYKTFYSYFNFYYQFYQIKEMYDICLEEFMDISKFLSTEQLNAFMRSKEISEGKVVQTGNKLLLNYCTAMKMLVEKIEAYLKHNQADKVQEFKDFCSNIYDNSLSYRFFMKLRNYIIHNRMPFTKLVGSLNEDCNLYIERDNLLKWKKWGIVKNDLEKMDDNIALQPFLPDVGSLVYKIYLQGLYYLAPEVINSIKNIEGFANKKNIKRFDFIECEKIEDIKKGICTIHPVPWKNLVDCIKELNKNPNINICLN